MESDSSSSKLIPSYLAIGIHKIYLKKKTEILKKKRLILLSNYVHENSQNSLVSHLLNKKTINRKIIGIKNKKNTLIMDFSLELNYVQ